MLPATAVVSAPPLEPRPLSIPPPPCSKDKKQEHPDPRAPLPRDRYAGGLQWIYQNTYVDLASFGPVIDSAMRKAGIERVG